MKGRISIALAAALAAALSSTAFADDPPASPFGWCAAQHVFVGSDPSAPSVYGAWCVPTLDPGGEEPGLYTLTNGEGHPALCAGLRVKDGTTTGCVIAGETGTVRPGPGGPAIPGVPVGPAGGCVSTWLVPGPGYAGVYAVGCLRTTTDETPRVHVLEDAEGNARPCLGLSTLGEAAWVCRV